MISSFIRGIVAKYNVQYENSSTQIDFPQEIASNVIAWGQRYIPEEDLHNDGKDTKGREDNIHATLLYGLKTKDPEDVRKILAGMKPFTIRLGLITGFLDKPAYDVLKIDVEAPELYRMHYALRNALPNDNSFPTYSPHCTVAYLKKGKALRFFGCSNFRNEEFPVNGIVFSTPDGNRIPITFK